MIGINHYISFVEARMGGLSCEGDHLEAFQKLSKVLFRTLETNPLHMNRRLKMSSDYNE